VIAVYERIAPSAASEQRKAAAARRACHPEIYLLFFLACVGITFVSLA